MKASKVIGTIVTIVLVFIAIYFVGRIYSSNSTSNSEESSELIEDSTEKPSTQIPVQQPLSVIKSYPCKAGETIYIRIDSLPQSVQKAVRSKGFKIDPGFERITMKSLVDPTVILENISGPEIAQRKWIEHLNEWWAFEITASKDMMIVIVFG